MIDIHTHILPGLDDGPKDDAAAVALARAAVAAGTEVMVATPHVDHVHGVSPRDIAPAVAALRALLEREGVPLAVLPGAETDLSRLLDIADDEVALLGLGGGPALLIETPHHGLDPNFDMQILELRLRVQHLVLAHPERSPIFQQDPVRLERLVSSGVLCSITAASMTGRFGRTAQASAYDLLERGFVHSVVSDAHDAVRRPPGVAEAFAAGERHLPGVSALAEWFTEGVPAAIIAGGPLPPRPDVTLTRRRRRFRRRP